MWPLAKLLWTIIVIVSVTCMAYTWRTLIVNVVNVKQRSRSTEYGLSVEPN